MLWIGLTILLAVSLLVMPIFLEAEGVWHDFRLYGRLVLKLGMIPFLWICVDAGLEPLTLETSVRALGTHARPLQKRRERSPQSQRIFLEVLQTLHCRTMKISFDLGIDQDAAATALGYGTLRALTEALILWARQRGACEYQSDGHAYFDQPKYEGKIKGIFQTTMAHIIVIIVKQWRKR